MIPFRDILRPVSEICADAPALDLPVDLQGWHSTLPFFAEVIAEVQPKLIIEVGTWKGASILHMAGLAPEADLIAVDTWTGSFEHWLDKDRRRELTAELGGTSVYRQFIANIASSPDASGRIFPLQTSSKTAARILEQCDVAADMVYIDGSHEFGDVFDDLCAYWRLLPAGGVMFGDDFKNHAGVYCDVLRFASQERVNVEEHLPFWKITKP